MTTTWRCPRPLCWLVPGLALLGPFEGNAWAQTRAHSVTGMPPAEADEMVTAPKADEAPNMDRGLNETTLSVSAGGLLTSGNSRLLALSWHGAYEVRREDHGFGASILGNYGQGAPRGTPVQVSTENVQGRLRYDRYVMDRMAVFLINTGRHDRFQGLDFRYNLDPGVKYLFLPKPARTLWAELGYDFQYDVRRDANRAVLDDNNNPVLGPDGQPLLQDKTSAAHSVRVFLGHRYAFSSDVTLAVGVEYLHSVEDLGFTRLNTDAVFTSKLVGGLSLGVGVVARYDSQPLPGSENLDTSTTLSFIYAFTDSAEDSGP